MTKPGWRFLIAMMWCVAATTPLHAQSPVDSLKTFSDFPSLKLDRLFAGEIFTERGALMNFPNGISGQTCFFVPASAETTAARLQTWDPSPHAELKVYGFRFLKSPADLEDFRGLSFQSGQHPVRWLMDKIVTTTDSKSELNLTRAEAQALAACTGRRADPANAATCWTKLLLDRATQFQRNALTGIPPYELPGPTAVPVEQLRAMLLEQASITHEFAPILQAIGLLGTKPAPNFTPVWYWTFFEADHHGAVALGAVYKLQVGDHYQLADVEYYVSNSYQTAVTLYEVWPMESGGTPGALVWRGDYFAAPMLAFTKGAERIAYGALMLQDIKKEVRCFQDSLKGKQ